MDIAVTPFGASDQPAIDAAYEIGVAVYAADVPDFPVFCRQQFEGSIRHPMPGTAQIRALATRDGAPAGYLELTLPQLENTENAHVDLMVHPAHRRQGVGRALHEHARRLLSHHGRKRLVGATVSALPGGPDRPASGDGFAAAMGATPALGEVRRRLEIASVDHERHDALLAEARAHAVGYRLVDWRQRTPAEYLADVAYLDGRIIMDAPMGELTVEPERVDADRVQAAEQALNARGRRRYHTGVVHEASGRLVAWTLIDMHASSRVHAFQQITIVDPAHRGHRLGLLAKIENLRRVLAHEPELREIDTWNAATNSYMISINERLGFRPVDAWTDWQLDL